MIKKNFLILLLCLIPAISSAITREASVEYALEKSEAIRISTESANVLRGESRQATAFTKPQVSLSGAYTEMGDNKPESPVPYLNSPDRNIAGEVTATQLLYAGGRIWRTLELGHKLNQQADIRETSGKRDIRKQVRMAFDAVLYQDAAIAILRDRLSQRQAELEDANDLRDAGMVTPLDVRQAKLNVNFAENELKSGEAAYQEAMIDFNLAIGRSGDDELLAPEGDLRNVPNLNAVLTSLDTALSEQDFLDVESAKTAAEAALLNYKIAHGQGLPEVLFVSTGKSDGEETDEMDESWTAGIQVRWDVFDGGLVRAKKASARAEMRQATDNLSRTQKGVAGEVEKIRVNIRSLEERIMLQQEAVELSQKNYEDARGHYRAGTITLTRLGEFSLSYAEARFNLLRLFFLQREQLISAEALLEK